MTKGKSVPAIVSIRDGGQRAASMARDLTVYGAQMLTLWPELRVDFADSHASWAAFDGGAVEAYDAHHAGVVVVRDERGAWNVAPEGYKVGSQSDQTLTAAWVRGINRTQWAAMKKDMAELYAIASPINRKVNVALAEARRVLKIAVNKAIAAEATGATKTKSGNRSMAEIVADTVKELDDKIKTGLSRDTITAEQADAIRAWLRKAPKI